jgi:exonuclease SbcC
MLPTRLELKNFLAYRSPDPVIFDGIHLACLSGQNGAGKSSLLDAITWAIWGKGRARSDDELIHVGQEEMQVTLDFLQSGDKYRVIRKRRLGNMRKDGRRGPGTTTLDFFAWDKETNSFRIINEPSVRWTQKRITEFLRLDYPTFVNSAFLQQGRADSFTLKTASERKEILAEVLGLDQWTHYEERAKRKLRLIENELSGISGRLADMEREMAEEDAARRDFEFAEQELAAIREAVAEAEASYDEMAGADVELKSAESELESVRRQIRERERDIASTHEEIARYQERLTNHQAIVAERESIEDGYAQLQEAREADQAFANALRELREVESLINNLERQIDEARQDIVKDITSSETLIEDSRQQADNVAEFQAQRDDILEEIVLLERDEKRREVMQQEIADFKEERSALREQNKTLHQEMNDIKERLDMIDSATEARCPLCNQTLDEDHRQQIATDLRDEGTERGNRYRGNIEQMELIKAEIEEREQSIAILEKSLPKLTTLRGELGRLDQQVRDAESAAQRVEEQMEHLDELRTILDEERFAEALHIQLQEALAQREKLGYDPGAHDEIREKMLKFNTFQTRATELQIAQQAIPDLERLTGEAQARIGRWEHNLKEGQKRESELQDALVDLQARAEEMKRRRDAWHHQRTLERQSIERVTALRQKLHAIEEMKRRYQDLKARQQVLQEEESIYQQLKNAFSKSGIPAMLIEAAIPELEETANRLLHRMTSGRMVLRFDTQREKKTGGIAETLDISISDDLGTRDYNLYSGGEAFRINFAIRVAISQLLARRAGAQLRTLFVDEGFGTQDEVGRQRLIEAINVVQDDFDLILVITHIDELRDMFPVRIEVEKMEQGSRVSII